MSTAEIRKDYIQERYVVIAPRRGTRPHDVPTETKAVAKKAASCAFCPVHPDHPAGIYCVGADYLGDCFPDNTRPWQIKVVTNKFPAVTLDNPKAYGIQEVIIETPDHEPELEDLPAEHIAKLLEVYAARTIQITKNNRIEYVIIFKNQGGRAGASLEHSHSQIFATDFIPPHLIDKSQRTQRYKLLNGSCVFCDVVVKEQASSRLIFEDDYLIVFCPYASMYNYEVWIMAKRHVDNVTMLSAEERLAWAQALKKILPKIVKLGLSYNFYFHEIVNDPDQHLYMKITPRGSIWAGVEIGSGVVINPVAPEDAAEYYRA
ncbi:MAG: hypothetical protein A2445_01240 [Candidatus Jacksonbacteria bacterium RIFOXYC2_FULL_44_29]|nr:MAG: Galactose-1-phosphate uridylyltransferase [Parcubacteria group bacterium GW2011_GWC2_44_22]OGY74961.1 MAG: hypothetical protein A2240_05270 [Candidatus Jacksonbacteria bacterium RIFOXYA2_FULL_43_12]OGY76514.1 MAG: hypothetical protein A2295_02055 [Candidatus Jacksonbacteria bacterium RIFOXYB2_FULL_44_15]OGY78494.1 MAG: hypothetical protein A2445_01240 [Candidatus Jacksonbacteria bacterium RIFOXYC2_FULL_44_29]OGY81151.1 MAG: hypothetical protein A2550_01635 [Candidatus Jacksonbacteria ba